MFFSSFSSFFGGGGGGAGVGVGVGADRTKDGDGIDRDDSCVCASGVSEMNSIFLLPAIFNVLMGIIPYVYHIIHVARNFTHV